MAVSSVSKTGFWRDAASILIAARWPAATTSTAAAADAATTTGQRAAAASKLCDYKFLMVKRSAKGFSASNHVYPGGTISDADYDPKWIDFYSRKASYSGVQDIMKSLRLPDRRPPVLQKSHNGVPADIAMRLCAIRETFEEAGILLAKPASYFTAQNNGHSGRPHKTSDAYLPADDSVFRRWRERIQPDASQFLAMCEELSVVPNIWSLFEWSNWLTPPLTKVDGPSEKPRRYDTMFYMSCLDTIPHAVVDLQEIVSLDWLSPIETVARRNESSITTGFPQAYESLRLSNFTIFDDLANFAVMRSSVGMNRIFGVVLICTDGFVLVHEGDYHYPDVPDYEGLAGPIVTKKSVAEVVSSGEEAMDRSTGDGMGGTYKLAYNLAAHPDGHLPLLTEEAVLRLADEQLKVSRL